MIRKLLNAFSSIKLTVVLLMAALLLVFFGTLDQVNYGIYEIQKRYFQSVIAFWSYPVEGPGGNFLKYLTIPLPGGGLLGVLLLLNLVCAHFKYFVLSWKKIGIALIHLGIVILLIGGYLIGYFQQEFQMWLPEGQRINFVQNIRKSELVIIDKTGLNHDTVWSIPENLLKKDKTIFLPTLGIEILIDDYYENVDIVRKKDYPQDGIAKATQGLGKEMDLTVFPRAKTYKQDEVNEAAAYVTLKHQGEVLGTWLMWNSGQHPPSPQPLNAANYQYEVALRFERKYLPFYLELIDFKHEKYPGSEIAKSFSSEVRILNEQTKTDRNVLIYMNHPLRHEGYTFYQAAFGPDETSSMLQVVKNPVRFIPYVGVWLTGIGLVVHFCIQLYAYVRRREEKLNRAF